jgi:hypothetical protein
MHDSECAVFTKMFVITVASRLSDLNGTEGWSDNQKCRIIQKTNEKDEGKYQLSLRYY